MNQNKIVNRAAKRQSPRGRRQDRKRLPPRHKKSEVYAKREVSSYSRITNTRLALGGADVGIVYFRGELQACQGLGQVSLQRTDHDKHEGLGVATE